MRAPRTAAVSLSLVLFCFVHLNLLAQKAATVPQKKVAAPTTSALFLVSEDLRFGYINKAGKAVLSGYEDAGDFSEGLAPVKVGGWYGYIDTTGTMVIPPRYAEAKKFSGGLACVRAGAIWGYIDKTGAWVIPLRFFDASNFSEGYAVVKLDEKFAVIDRKGTTLTVLPYAQVWGLSEGLIGFMKDKQWGFVDRTGKVVIPPQFSWVGDFSGGLALAKNGGKTGFIDKSGKWVIEAKYDDAADFSEGLAAVMRHKREVVRDGTGRVVRITVFDLWGYVDGTGKEVLPLDFVQHESVPFSEGLAGVWKDKQFGYVDKTGKMVVATVFNKKAGAFHDGLAKVELGEKYGYVNVLGKVVVPIQFAKLGAFSDGLAMAQVQSDGRWGYIDTTGKFIIQPQFFNALGFRNGRAAVHMYSWEANQGISNIIDQWVVVDRTGAVVLKPQVDNVAWYTQKVMAGSAKAAWGIFDAAGQPIIAPEFESVRPLNNDFLAVTKNGKCGVVDGSGKLVVNPQFDECGWAMSEGMLSVKLNGKYGFVAADGVIRIEPQYEAVSGFTPGGFSAVKSGGKWGFVDRSGKLLIPAKYDLAVGFFEDRAAVKTKDHWGFIDKTGKAIVEPQFAQAGYFSGGLAPVKVGERWGYVDKTGKLAIPAQFDHAAAFQDGLAKVYMGSQNAYLNTAGKTVWISQLDQLSRSRAADAKQPASAVAMDADGMRTLKVKVAVDQLIRKRPDWQKTIDKRVETVSGLYKTNFRIRLINTGTIPWTTPALADDANPDRYMHDIFASLEENVPLLDAEMVVGFTGQDEHSRTRELGLSQYFTQYALIRDTFARSAGVEDRAVGVATHELCHNFGMFHVKDDRSFMHFAQKHNPNAGLEQWRFDPYTVKWMDLVRTFDFNKGIESLDEQTVKAAAAIFETGNDPNSDIYGRKETFPVAWGYLGEGRNLRRLGLSALASRKYYKGMALVANDPDPLLYQSMGLTMMDLKSSQEGLDYLRKCTVVKPDYALCHNELGHWLEQVSADDVSYAQRWPMPALAEILTRYVARPTSDEALDQYREAARVEPDNAFYRHRLALALLNRGKAKEALPEAQQAVKLEPRNGYYQVTLENVSRAAGK